MSRPIAELAAAVARNLLDLDHLAFLADGGAWDELRFPAGAGGPAWSYRLRDSGITVERSPHGSGRVAWSELRAIADATVAEEEPAKRVRAIWKLEHGLRATPTRLRAAGLAEDATAEDVHRAARNLTRRVINDGIARCGGEQLPLFPPEEVNGDVAVATR